MNVGGIPLAQDRYGFLLVVCPSGSLDCISGILGIGQTP